MGRKIIGTLMKAIVAFLFSWIIIFATVEVAVDYLDDYNVFDTEDTPAIVMKKVSVNNLTSKPKYFVVVDLNATDEFNGVKNRVFAWQFKQLEVGDTVKGHHIHGEHFFTTLDIFMDSLDFILLILLLFLFVVGLFMWPVFGVLALYEKEERPSEEKKKAVKKKRKKIIKPLMKRVFPEKAYRSIENMTFKEVILIAISVIALLGASSFTVNGLFKISPIGKTKTTAYVIDSTEQSATSSNAGAVSDPYYAVDIIFEDKKGNEYRVIKEVTRSVYKKHEVGGSIDISYVSSNPYNVFVPDFSFWSILEIVRYGKFWLSNMILFMPLLYLAYYFRKKKKEKKRLT